MTDTEILDYIVKASPEIPATHSIWHDKSFYRGSKSNLEAIQNFIRERRAKQ